MKNGGEPQRGDTITTLESRISPTLAGSMLGGS